MTIHETEIVELHEFFEGWLGGTLPGTDDAFDRFERAIGDTFTFIGPDGTFLERAELVSFLRAAHGSRPGLRIRIKNAVRSALTEASGPFRAARSHSTLAVYSR